MDGLRSLNAFWAEICLGQQQNFVGNFFGSTKFWSEIFLGQKNFGQKFFGVKKCWVTKNCGSKKFGVNKNSGRKFVWVNKKNWVKKIVGQQKFGRKFFWVNFFFRIFLRAPPMVADEAKLAIVFTYFFFLSFPTPSAFHPLRRNSHGWNKFPPNNLA